MTDREVRFVVVAVIGVTLAVVYTAVLFMGWRSHQRHHDNRSRRDLLEKFARFLTAWPVCLAILATMLGDPLREIRGDLTILALGAFLGAGIVELTDRSGK